jgi:hypothetical protein
MRLHSNLTTAEVGQVLYMAKAMRRVTNDVAFMQLYVKTSNTHPNGYDVQLGTYNKRSLPKGTVDQYGKAMNVRRAKNTGVSGASQIYSATYDEWGWFMAGIFALDPCARWGNSRKHPIYEDVIDFHRKTGYKFQGLT